jgi:adenylylsulfate kinase
MPSAGKSTLAHAVGERLAPSRDIEILDGDEVRLHLSQGLGFTKIDRDTNVRRIGFVARLLARHGVCVITAAISPYAEIRDEIRSLAAKDGIGFIEIFVSARLETLLKRDVKGLYKRALAGEIAHFTGISDPYEAPLNPDITVQTDAESIEECVERVLSCLTRLSPVRDVRVSTAIQVPDESRA